VNYIFWNTNRKAHIEYISEIVSEYDIDFIILAEFPENQITYLIRALNLNNQFYLIPNISNKKIHIITKMIPSKIDYLEEDNNVRFLSFFDLDIKERLNLGLIHLPSKLHASENDILIPIQRTNSMIDDIEKNNELTILIGDFNMNPFEQGMLSANGFHAFPRKIESKKNKRVVQTIEKKIFYNPMWKYLIREDNPIGSYYYTSGGAYTLHWHVFDQVLLRPQLIPFLNRAELIGSFKDVNLIRNNKPNKEVSDHLPLFMKLNNKENN